MPSTESRVSQLNYAEEEVLANWMSSIQSWWLWFPRFVSGAQPLEKQTEDKQMDSKTLDPQRRSNLRLELNQQPQLEGIGDLIKGIYSRDLASALGCTRTLRRIVNENKKWLRTLVRRLIELNAMPRLLELLQMSHRPDIQLEAARLLSDAIRVTKEQRGCLVTPATCRIFIRLIEYRESDLNEVPCLTLRMLGEIASDNRDFRDMLIEEDIVPRLICLVNRDVPVVLLRMAAWCLNSLFSYRSDLPTSDIIVDCLPSIKMLLMHESSSVSVYACWSLSNIVYDCKDYHILQVLELGVLDHLVELMCTSNDRHVVHPALNVVATIATISDNHARLIVDHGGLTAFGRVSLSRNVKRYADIVAWTLVNITAGSDDLVVAVVDAGLLPILVQFLHMGDESTRENAALAISNVIHRKQHDHIDLILEEGVLHPLIEALMNSVNEDVGVCVTSALRDIAFASRDTEYYDIVRKALESTGVLDAFER